MASGQPVHPEDRIQCKHYKESLKPREIWIELGKLAYCTLKGEYTLPRR